MSLSGYIKIHRKMLEWGWYDDMNVFKVFMHLLLTANYKETTWRTEKLKPGQRIIGRNQLAEDLGLSIRQVRTALEKLEKTGEITQKSTNKYTVITIEKWINYQLDDKDSDKPTTNKRQSNDKPTTTAKEREEYKKDKKVYSTYGWVKLSDEEYKRLVDEFTEDRVKHYIRVVDESAQGSGNKNKWKDWNIVVRKYIKNKWGEPYKDDEPKSPHQIRYEQQQREKAEAEEKEKVRQEALAKLSPEAKAKAEAEHKRRMEEIYRKTGGVRGAS